MTQNLKSNTKLTMFFYELWLVSFTPQSSDYSRKYHLFFLKMHILLYHPYLPQVITILSLSSIHQPPWTTNLKLLMHLKIDLHSFFLNSYELKTTSLSLSLHIHPKKRKIFILKILWFIESLKLTILGGSLLFEILGVWRRLFFYDPGFRSLERIRLASMTVHRSLAGEPAEASWRVGDHPM